MVLCSPPHPRRSAGLPLACVLMCLVLPGLPRETFAAPPCFQHEVMATFSKAGCNLGTCHGNQNGKAGFRLSLRGQDPEFDFQQLTRQYATRRVDPLVPEQSLILLKATNQIPHQGGKRFDVDSPMYQTLRDWIAAGTPEVTQGDAELKRLEIAGLDAPGDLTIVEGPRDSFALQVIAHFADGSQRDVTEMAVYEPSNLLVEVDPRGVVQRLRHGESTVIVRYLHLQQPVRLAFIAPGENFQWEAPRPHGTIDRLAFAKLRHLKTNPSAICDDYQFLRRATFDLLGIPPSGEEARAFVANDDPRKREQLVEALLGRPEYATHWAMKWSDMLRNEEKSLDSRGVEVFHEWIRESFAAGKPLDQFVRELVVARGSTYDHPPANFWRANRDSLTRAESTARLFLGVRLQCAKCHNHPFDRWSQDDYYNWATVFARIDYKVEDNQRRDKFDKNEFVGEQTVLVKDSGEVKNANTGRDAHPQFLGADPLQIDAKADRLVPLAQWLTSADNRLFARVQANYLWKQVMGVGLVEPIDDFRHTNPASNPALLDYLTQELVASGFDQRHLLRLIMNSQVYQLSATPNDSNAHDTLNYSHALVQRHTAEQLLDAQCRLLEVSAEFAGYDRGMRAGELPGVRKVRPRDGGIKTGDRFLLMFGKPERIVACDCERTNETTLGQAFLLVGGEGLQQRLTSSENRLRRMAASDRSSPDLAIDLYWAALSREPTAEELQAAVEIIEADRLAGLQDLAWALINAKEFIFRH
jgi:hypothetical protein